ncbi:MAG: hypothetical protein ACI9OO_000857 [Bacteroidia bacterium]|jgi:hypothetical protein
MQTFMKTLMVATLATASAASFAARPTSVMYTGEGVTDAGLEYSSYAVKCTNGQRYPLTAWDNRRKWCVGENSADECHRKQIKAAKKACKAG